MKLDGLIDAKKDGQKDWQIDYYEASYNWKWDPHNLNCSKLFLYSIVFEHKLCLCLHVSIKRLGNQHIYP